jgi:hypothetical protein
MGFCRNIAHSIMFGSCAHGGHGLTPQTDYQGVNQTTLLVQHLRLMDSIGTMLAIGYSWYQLHCGVSFQALSNPTAVLPYDPSGWFSHHQKFLALSEISVDLPAWLLRTPKPLRQGNINLMEAFNSLGWKTPKLKLLNLCRFYLQVETLAEISNPDGTCILAAAWKGTTLPSLSTFHWPNQGRPQVWATWHQAIASLFLRDTASTYRQVGTLTLRHRLGRWHEHHSEHRRWPAYQTDLHLFIKSARGYRAHTYTMQGRLPSRCFNATPVGRHSNPHTIDNAVPAKPTPSRRNTISAIIPIGYFRHQDLDRSNTVPTTF